jgi:hypothetical protein
LTEGLAPMALTDYQSRIGLRSTQQCWGYTSLEEMLSTDPKAQSGLQFVKRQLLPQSGLAYTEVVSVMPTTFINPVSPKERDKTIFESPRYSYEFRQSLVDEKGPRQCDLLAQFLSSYTEQLNLAPLLQSTTAQKSSTSRHGRRKYDPRDRG